jgi:hypothetical protein
MIPDDKNIVYDESESSILKNSVRDAANTDNNPVNIDSP